MNATQIAITFIALAVGYGLGLIDSHRLHKKARAKAREIMLSQEGVTGNSEDSTMPPPWYVPKKKRDIIERADY